VDQSQFEIQLKVWKDLAISKQMLMRSTAEALGLDPNCEQDELKQSLEVTLKRVREAETSVAEMQAKARQTIAETERKLEAAQRAQKLAQAEMVKMRETQEKAAPQLAADRANAAKEIQTLKNQVAEKDKAIKAINVALADTPENVVKKLKQLKKEKQDEADLRKQIESTFATLRKEKQDQDKELSELKDNSSKLVTKYRELHEEATKLHEQLKPLAKEGEELAALQMLDDKLLEAIVPPEKDDKKEAKGKKK
jgi:colicin import membrane protein